MNSEDILRALTRILCDLLGDDTVDLTMDVRREDVPGWDSFAYINFIVALEHEFNVRFRVAEVESFECVGQIVERIRQALEQK